MMNKKQQRAQFAQKRNALLEEERQVFSEQICEQLKQLFSEYEADAFLAFYPLGSEASLVSFMEEVLLKGDELALPKVEGEEIVFYKISSFSQLEEGCFHVMEPKEGCEPFAFEQKKVAVLTPGLVFDADGYRMGYGKGYYDRFFAAHPDVLKVGVAFDVQMALSVVHEEYDVPLDVVVTPGGRKKKANRQD
ncbi:MAG: 5-formyltetrahydrofolate cyclo-ligase [Eubacterium sp.]|nr:5-formyltetrahydrofolate cyclo-ligase [Eubacterium sp.]